MQRIAMRAAPAAPKRKIHKNEKLKRREFLTGSPFAEHEIVHEFLSICIVLWMFETTTAQWNHDNEEEEEEAEE